MKHLQEFTANGGYGAVVRCGAHAKYDDHFRSTPVAIERTAVIGECDCPDCLWRALDDANGTVQDCLATLAMVLSKCELVSTYKE